MEAMKLSFGVMLGFLQQAIKESKEPRKESNAKRYELKDNVLDKIPAEEIFKVFNKIYQVLHREGYLKGFNYLGGLLIALGGTQHFSSEKIHCEK